MPSCGLFLNRGLKGNQLMKKPDDISLNTILFSVLRRFVWVNIALYLAKSLFGCPDKGKILITVGVSPRVNATHTNNPEEG
jgi:hypothetical protein